MFCSDFLCIENFWLCYCLNFHLLFFKFKGDTPSLLAQHTIVLVLIGMVFVIIQGMFHVRISLNSVLLLLLPNQILGVVPGKNYIYVCKENIEGKYLPKLEVLQAAKSVIPKKKQESLLITRNFTVNYKVIKKEIIVTFQKA